MFFDPNIVAKPAVGTVRDDRTFIDPGAIAKADDQRTALQFVSFLNGVVGNDQSLANADGVPINYPSQYQTVSPYGVAVEGRPISNIQSATLNLPPIPLALLVMGAAAFLVLKK